MQPHETIIQTRDLTKEYLLGTETVPVLKGIDLHIRRGEYVAIMGHSGTGKSTLLNIIGCLDQPSGGTYLLNSIPVSSFSPARLAAVRNREIGFVFQNFSLLPRLDVFANVELPLIYGNVPAPRRKEMVDDTLHRFGLWERRHHKPNEISGGQKQRTAIARAIVKKPSLILADEPTGNLDSTTTAEIMEVFGGLHAEGNTIVVITHESDVAARAGRIIHLFDGRVRQ